MHIYIYISCCVYCLQVNPIVDPNYVPFRAHGADRVHRGLDRGEIATPVGVHAEKRGRVGVGRWEIGWKVVADTGPVRGLVIVGMTAVAVAMAASY